MKVEKAIELRVLHVLDLKRVQVLGESCILVDNVVQVGREDLAAKEGHTQIVAPGDVEDRKSGNVFSQGIGIDTQFRQLLLQIGMVPDAPAVMEVIPNFWRDIG